MESGYPSLPSYPPLPPPVSEEPSVEAPSTPLSLLSTTKPPEASSGSLQQAPVNMASSYIRLLPSTQQYDSMPMGSTDTHQQYSSSGSLPVQPTPVGVGVTSPHLAEHMALHSLYQPPAPSSSNFSTPSGTPMSGSNVPYSTLTGSIPISGNSTWDPNTIGTPPLTSRSIPISSGTSSTTTLMDASALGSGTANAFQGGGAGTLPSADNGSILRLRYLEELCIKLNKEKKTIEDDFGRQRKKFMNHILQSDAAIASAKSNSESLSNEVRELSTQLLLKDEEVKDIRMASKIAEAQAKEAIDADRIKYEEEIASLRQILSVQSQEHENSLAKEREQWQNDKDKLIADLKKLKAEEVAGHLSPGSRQASPEDCLETSMAKAALDTQILRSVVVPLEQELEALRRQLAEKGQKESENLAQGASSQVVGLETPTASVGDNNGSLQEEQPPLNGGNKLQHQLDLERSARHDLEMHAKQVETQKSVLQEEVKSLRTQLEKVRREFVVEEKAHIELKKTWELANQHFIVAQDKLKAEIYRLHQKLERGESASPLRQLPEFEVPQVQTTKEGEGTTGTVKQVLSLPRVHRRSLSTEESSDTNLLKSPERRKSSSCNDLHTVTTIVATNAEEIGDLATKVTSLQTQLDEVQEELDRRVTMCEGYEKQLLRVQEQMVAEMDDKEFQIVRLKAELEKYEAGIMRERKLRQEMRRQIDGIRDEIGTRIESFQQNEQDVKQQLNVVRDKFTEITQDTQKEITRLNHERGRIHQQMQSAQEEYDCLKVVHAEEMKHLAEMKSGKKEAELNLQSSVEQFSSLQSQASAREENLRNELALVMDQIRKERGDFETRWRDLMTELEKSKQENVSLEALKEELERERRAKEEAVSGKQLVEMKSKQFIASQQQQMESLNKARESAEHQVRDLQKQLSQLKHHLSHTEETQKDYVELSQTLQKRLAEMEDLQQSQEAVALSPSPT